MPRTDLTGEASSEDSDMKLDVEMGAIEIEQDVSVCNNGFSAELQDTKTPDSISSSSSYFSSYFSKFQGVPGKFAPEVSVTAYSVIWSLLLSFIGILLVSVLDEYYLFPNYKIRMLSGALGAVSVLLFDACQAPFAQPYNVWVGFTMSSFIGVTVAQIGNNVGIPMFIQAPLAVSITVSGMKAFKCTFPPGGACALIATIGGPEKLDMGYGYVLISMGAILILFIVNIFGNNVVSWNRYPQYWY
jgi:CBS domain-containing membrane protein